jgi:hypothetical protein
MDLQHQKQPKQKSKIIKIITQEINSSSLTRSQAPNRLKCETEVKTTKE